MINIHSFKVTNFLSFYGVHEYTFETTGMHFIQGINNDTASKVNMKDDELQEMFSVGSGKTSFTQIPLFAFYGKIMKRVNKDEVVNKIAKKNCCVELVFDIDSVTEYKIVRYRKHDEEKNNLYILKKENNKWFDISYEDLDDTEELIQKLIRLNLTTFQKSVLFHREDIKHFLDLSTTHRSDMFENIVSQMSEMDDYFNLIKKGLKALLNKINEIELLKSSTQGYIQQSNEHLKFLTSNNTDKNNEFQKNLKKYQTLISQNDIDLITQYKKIDVQKQKLTSVKNEYDNKIKNVNRSIQTVNDSIAAIKYKIKSYSKLKESFKEIDCPNCSHHFFVDEDADNQMQEIENNLKEFNKELKENTQKIKTLEANLKEYKNQIKELDFNILDEQLNDIALPKSIIKLLKEENDEEIKQLIDSTNIVKQLTSENIFINKEFELNKKELFKGIQKYTKELDKYKTQIEKLKVKEKDLQFWFDVLNLKNEHSIKQYVLNEIIPVFNYILQQIIDYVYYGDLHIVFDSFLEEMIYKDGKKYKYAELSTGEKLKLNLCINLAIFDLTRIHMSGCSIMFLDEVLTNVDQPTIQIFIDLFQEKYSENCAVYMISHQQEVKEYLSPLTTTNIIKDDEKSNIQKIKH